MQQPGDCSALSPDCPNLKSEYLQWSKFAGNCGLASRNLQMKYISNFSTLSGVKSSFGVPEPRNPRAANSVECAAVTARPATEPEDAWQLWSFCRISTNFWMWYKARKIHGASGWSVHNENLGQLWWGWAENRGMMASLRSRAGDRSWSVVISL